MKHKPNFVHIGDSMMAIIILLQILLLLLSEKVESAGNISLPGCQDICGGIPIPYPFGIGTNCSLSEDFDVTCNSSYNGIPFLPKKNNGKPTPYWGAFEIVNISVPSGQARFNLPISSQCYNTTTKKDDSTTWGFFFSDSGPFWLNNEKNKLIVTGCNTLAYLTLDASIEYSVGCLSTCDSVDSLKKYGASCSGIGCCQTALPKDTTSFFAEFDDRYNHSLVYNFSPCSYAMVVDADHGYVFNTTSITTYDLVDQTMPAVFDWAIGNTTCKDAETNKSAYACKSDHSVCLNSVVTGQGYICNCSEGYQGNPYLQGGCQDIDECAIQNPCSKLGRCHNLPGKYRCSCHFGWRSTHNDTQNPCDLNLDLVIGSCAGLVILSFLGLAIYIVLQRRNFSKVKQKYFQQHGGWILLEKIKSKQAVSFTIFTEQQLEQATNNFDSANIIGHGGQGTVYKGILRDQIVAIKKCKIVDESKKKEFGKEILILSQINHKNIVKLLGCCLEVDVPMLVYEFIPNGTLFHYIHHKKPGSHIPLITRLRVAHESAEALAYLHTSASPPIFHGDVKSANILLDQNYTARVSDFGASMQAPKDKVQFVTLVQGTCGYLDPEYMQSCQLTDKSDVYSFGVILVELLTSKPVIDFDAPEEERSLSSRFLLAIKENKLHELLDDEIKHEDDMKLIIEVVGLAKECLSIKGEERPLMKEVAEELQRISKLKQHPWGQEYNTEETRSLLSEESHHNIEIEHSGYYFNVDKEAEQSIAVGR